VAKRGSSSSGSSEGSDRKKKVAAEGEPLEQLGRENRTDGPSPLTDVDRMALGDAKSEWQERTAPAAGDPLSAAELDGLSLLGGSDIRDGAIGGVSDPIRDGSGGPRERPDEGIAPGGKGTQRRNPPLVADSATADGGLSASGGVAGGARGHGGSSDRANPARESDAGPGEHRSTSRIDLDRPDER
jgi:hypothetical protein